MTDHRAPVAFAIAAVGLLALVVLYVGVHATADPEPGDDVERSTATATPLPTSPIVPATAAPAVPAVVTTSTTTTEAVVVAAASEPVLSGGSCGGHGDLIARYFPAEQVGKACRVMLCESGGSATAQNPRSSASGAWQFLSGTWAKARQLVPGAEQYAVAAHAPMETQTAVAAAWWRATSWSQWVCA